MPVGFEADEGSTDSVDEGDVGAARMTLDRKILVNPQPHTAGGLSIFRSIDLDESEEDIKTSAGQIYGVWVSNMATSTRFVKFYNLTAANTTVGSSTPVITIAVPGNASDDVTGLFSSTHGIAFDTAICAAATTGIADADTGAPSANDVAINVFYK
jgi:sulfite reductase alpha subunit-like flavoprotein